MLIDFTRQLFLWLLLVSAPLLLAAGVPPLDESQRVRLETADQGSQTVDEAAFYALLENARDWPDEPSTATAGDEEVVLADMSKMMSLPGAAAWQGRLVMLEGTLEAMMPEHQWSRRGFGDVKGLNLRVQGQPVILYLTDPPALHTGGLKGREVAQKGADVKVIARFFKLVERPSEGGESKLYPVFVGRQVMSIDTGANGTIFPIGAAVPLLALLVAGCVFLLYYRVRGMGRRTVGGMTMAEYHARKERQRQPLEQPAEAPAEPHDIALPDDPAAALDAMSHDGRRPQ